MEAFSFHLVHRNHLPFWSCLLKLLALQFTLLPPVPIKYFLRKKEKKKRRLFWIMHYTLEFSDSVTGNHYFHQSQQSGCLCLFNKYNFFISCYLWIVMYYNLYIWNCYVRCVLNNIGLYCSVFLLIGFQRVKVYRLNADGKWDDQGTGHVTVDYLEVCTPFR